MIEKNIFFRSSQCRRREVFDLNKQCEMNASANFTITWVGTRTATILKRGAYISRLFNTNDNCNARSMYIAELTARYLDNQQ